MIINLEVGDLVFSIAGHDKSKYAIVLSRVNENFVLIADGTLKTIDNPKLKRMKHLKKVGQAFLPQESCDKLDDKIIASKIKLLTSNLK